MKSVNVGTTHLGVPLYGLRILNPSVCLWHSNSRTGTYTDIHAHTKEIAIVKCVLEFLEWKIALIYITVIGLY